MSSSAIKLRPIVVGQMQSCDGSLLPALLKHLQRNEHRTAKSLIFQTYSSPCFPLNSASIFSFNLPRVPSHASECLRFCSEAVTLASLLAQSTKSLTDATSSLGHGLPRDDNASRPHWQAQRRHRMSSGWSDGDTSESRYR
jgi:hypothetical protein